MIVKIPFGSSFNFEKYYVLGIIEQKPNKIRYFNDEIHKVSCKFGGVILMKKV